MPSIKVLFQFLGGARDYYLNCCDAETAELMHTYLSEQAAPFDPLDQEQLLYRLLAYSLAIIFAPTADFVRRYLIHISRTWLLSRTAPIESACSHF